MQEHLFCYVVNFEHLFFNFQTYSDSSIAHVNETFSINFIPKTENKPPFETFEDTFHCAVLFTKMRLIF